MKVWFRDDESNVLPQLQVAKQLQVFVYIYRSKVTWVKRQLWA